MNIFDAANYFLAKVDREAGDTITHLKLQKLTYYSQAWHLALEDEPLFDATFEAWAHGPVNPELFQEYRIFSWDGIPYPDDFDLSSIEDGERDFLDEIWEAYGCYEAKYLESLTHQELPWLEARGKRPEGAYCSTPIKETTMREFYRGLIDDGEES